MAPRKAKDAGTERPEEQPRDEQDPRRKAAPEVGDDPREEDGWDQPQSSAQKGPNATGEPET